MPPKQRITKEMLLEQAYKIAEEQGLAAVTSRSIAKGLGCSIRPVFCQFSTMEELRQATFEYACSRFVQEVMALAQRPDFFPQVTQWVLRLAQERPNLFRMLYLSGRLPGKEFPEWMMGFESSQAMVARMQELYGLGEAACRDVLLRSCIFLVGLGAMRSAGSMELSDGQAAELMRRTVADMVRGAKEDAG